MGVEGVNGETGHCQFSKMDIGHSPPNSDTRNLKKWHWHSLFSKFLTFDTQLSISDTDIIMKVNISIDKNTVNFF